MLWRTEERLRITAAMASVLLALGCDAGGDDLVLVGILERTLVEVVATDSQLITEVAVGRGDRAKAGQFLLQLDPIFAEAELARAEAGLAAAKTRALVATRDLQRAERLSEDRVTSEHDLDAARLIQAEADARLREANALLAAAKRHHADLRVQAPVAGVIDQLPFDRGERPPVGGVVAVIVADGPPWIRVWLPERAIAAISNGLEAEIEVDGVAGVLPGRVVQIAREPEYTPHYALTERERVHLVYEARVEIEGAPEWLRPGVPAQVTLPFRPERARFAPRLSAPPEGERATQGGAAS